MTASSTTPKEFTGRHMLGIMIAFFSVIIAVNLLMATLANTSWTGLVVKNTYVASQEFNRKAQEGRAQAELGWQPRLAIADGTVRYAMLDRAGHPVAMTGVTMTFRHPAYDKMDVTLTLVPAAGGEFTIDHLPTDGLWIVDVEAQAGLPHPYRDIRRVTIAGGTLR